MRRRRRLPTADDATIANVHHAAASPVFRRLRRRYHLLLGGEVAALSIVGLAAVGLTMRPVTDRQLDRDVRNRDVMLCLDVSTSMNEFDAIVLREFAELAAGLRGERIGLTIFNGSAITVFPLTDDAEFIETTLDEAATSLAQRKRSFVEGTEEGGTSLIGDGLASCAMRFDSDDRGQVAVDRLRHRQRPRRRADPAAPGGRRRRRRARHPRLRDRRRRPHHRGGRRRTTRRGRVDRRCILRDRRSVDDRRRRRRDRSARGQPPRRTARDGRRRPADDLDRRRLRRARRPVRRRMGAATMSGLTFDPLVPVADARGRRRGRRRSQCGSGSGAARRPATVSCAGRRWACSCCSSPPTRRSAVAGRLRQALRRQRAVRRRHDREHGGPGLQRRRAPAGRRPPRHRRRSPTSSPAPTSPW